MVHPVLAYFITKKAAAIAAYRESVAFDAAVAPLRCSLRVYASNV